MLRLFQCQSCLHEEMINIVFAPVVDEKDRPTCPKCGSKKYEIK
jgi:Zn finger protein HypA/HybF involved in hydrogenase expression